MSELLHFATEIPPQDVLHHAILYQDGLQALLPEEEWDGLQPGLADDWWDFWAPEEDRVARNSLLLAEKEGLFRPLLARQVLQDSSVRDAAWATFRQVHVNREARLVGLRSEERAARLEAPVELRPFIMQLGETDGLPIGQYSWNAAIEEAFGKLDVAPFYCEPYDRCVGCVDEPHRMLTSFQRSVLLAGIAYSAAEKAKTDTEGPRLLPCFPPAMHQIISDFNPQGRKEKVLAAVGQYLPQPPCGIETTQLIEFRRRYEDERHRLIFAVEELVRKGARTYGWDEPHEIERDVKQELAQALNDLVKAGRSRWGVWGRGAGSFILSVAAGAVGGPVAGAAASVTANWASDRTSFLHNPELAKYHYMHLVRQEQRKFDNTVEWQWW